MTVQEKTNSGQPLNIKYDMIKFRHPRLIQHIKDNITHINIKSAILFINLIYTARVNSSTDFVKVSDIKSSISVKNKNRKLMEEVEYKGKNILCFKQEFVERMCTEFFVLLDEIYGGKTIQEVSEEENKILFERMNGKGNGDTRTPTMDVTYADLEKYMCDNGAESNFVFDFSNTSVGVYENKPTVQIIEISVNSKGEDYTHPLRYNYSCMECGKIHNLPTYLVHSTENKIMCDNKIEHMSKTGIVTLKQCNKLLRPIKNMVETKTFYFCNGTYKTGDEQIQTCTLTSERELPLGNLIVAVVHVPTEYNKLELHVIDYKPLEKSVMNITDNGEHKVLTLIKDMDNHIEKIQHYKHFGYTPMKIAMLIQCASRYLDGISNNFNIALVGGASVGKTVFADMYGSLMYGPAFFTGSAGSISIPMLRGTMEKIRIHNKEYIYQTHGMLGEKDLIAIDELREEQNLKTALKPFMRASEYSYAKAGGSSQLRTRTAQMIVTENINIGHLQHYRNKVKKYYESNIIFKDSDVESGEPWNEEWDLELPLYQIKNKKLQYAIHQVRTSFLKAGINWIDGEDSAADDRFVFYFYLSGEKTNEKFENIIKKNSINNGNVYKKVELSKTLFVDNLKDMFLNLNLEESLKKIPYIGNNEDEYVNKISPLLNKYKFDSSPRSKDDFIKMLKIVRMIDGRDNYIKKDLDIIEYLIQNIKSKVEIVDTEEFMLKDISKVDIPEVETCDAFNYKGNMNLLD